MSNTEDRLDSLTGEEVKAAVLKNLDFKWDLEGYQDPFKKPVSFGYMRGSKENGNDLPSDMEGVFPSDRSAARSTPRRGAIWD